MKRVSTIHTVTEEIHANLYGLRSARELRNDCAAHGDLHEAKRHDDRMWRYAETIRNIVRERGSLGPDAFLRAQKELRT